MSNRTFTIEEIRKYIMSQESRGDIIHYLSEENIIAANQPKVSVSPDPNFPDEFPDYMSEDDLIPVEEFNGYDLDGHGYLAKKINGTWWIDKDVTVYEKGLIIQDDPDFATHVLWFNK